MTVHEGTIEVPVLEIEDIDVFVWFRDKLTLGGEFMFEGGFIVPLEDVKNHYCILFSSYIEFMFEEDTHVLAEMRIMLNNILCIIDNYIEEYYSFVYIC